MYKIGLEPEYTAVFGIVMLPKPAVPFGPVIVKETVVVLVGRYDAIMASDICELVTFPLIARSTVAPVPVVAVTFVVVDGVGVGVIVGLGVGVDVGVEVAEFTVMLTALEAGDVTGLEALSVTTQVITCDCPAAV